ncbi:MAG: hypothetical protein H6Q89_2721, partial [Myxococcaceae bacterium]|nr:hypothetical protein [Myxococcaceae bacterium]
MNPPRHAAPTLALLASLALGQAPASLARDFSQCDLALPAGTIEVKPADLTRGFGPAEVIKAIEVRFEAGGKSVLASDREAFLVLARCAALSKNDLLVRTSAPVDPALFTEAVRRSGELLRLADEAEVAPDQLAIEVSTRADLQPSVEVRVALVGRPETAFVEADVPPSEVEQPRLEEQKPPEPKTEQELKAAAERAVREAAKAEQAEKLAQAQQAKEAKALAAAKVKEEKAAAIREEKEEREAIERYEKHAKARAAVEKERRAANEKREEDEKAGRAEQ